MNITEDKSKLYRHFSKDPVLFAYHIGDLDDFFFPICRWPVMEDDNGEIMEAILIYDHPKNETVMAFGMTEQFGPFVESIIDVLPNRFYGHFQKRHQEVFARYFRMKSLGPNQKMKLESYTACHDEDADRNIRRLDKTDVEATLRFYQKAYPDGYFDPRMLATGKYLGYFLDNKLVSVAGVHVYAPEYSVAVLGSIATLPESRNRGLATQVTSRLVQELVAENLMVCLNVRSSNMAAISSYRKLGFGKVIEYEEAVFERWA